MIDKPKVIKEIILKNPNLSGNEIYNETKAKGVGIRKTDFYKLLRKIRNLSEPSITKREKSVPTKYKIKPTAKPKVKVRAKPKAKPKAIPFEKTKFGKMVKTVQTVFNVDEKNAINYTRKVLKIPKIDYDKLDQVDKDILNQYGY